MKYHRIGGTLWSIKDKTLAKRLVKEFDKQELQNMVNYWMEIKYPHEAVQFNVFYTTRHLLSRDTNSEYKWE